MTALDLHALPASVAARQSAERLLAEPTEAEFARLARLVDALPPTADWGTVGFLKNWVAASAAAWRAGEAGAARFQLRQVAGALARLG